MARVLIASSNPWSFAMATERALIRRHSADRVDLLDLYTLSSRHSPHWRPFDRFAEALNRKISRFLSPQISGSEITDQIRSQLSPAKIPELTADTATLRDYRVGDAQIGRSVLSSAISVTTIQNVGTTKEYGEAIDQAWKSANLSWEVGRAVAKLGYDAVYIFNGRHCYSRPFCDALAKETAVYRYEQGGTGDRFIVSDEELQRPSVGARLILEHPYDPAAGARFFEKRIAKAPGNDATFFTGSQVSGLLPKDLGERPLVTFFTSSSDELYAASDTWAYGEFANQYEVALAIAKACAATGQRLVVRFHPHLQFKHRSWIEEWDFEQLRRLSVIVVAPNDPIDTYALMRASRAVFTCGSTAGFEASFLGIPSAEVGGWTGGELGAMARILTPSELEAFVKAPSSSPEARQLALRYGSYASTAGELLTELDVGSHPYYARIAGRIVDPVRYTYHRLREPISARSRVVLPPGGKVIVEPSVANALAKRSSSQRLSEREKAVEGFRTEAGP